MDEAYTPRQESIVATGQRLFIPPRSGIWWMILSALVIFEIFLVFIACDLIERDILADDKLYFSRSKFPIPVPGWGVFVIIVIFALTIPVACFGPAQWIYRRRPNLTVTGEGILFNTLNETHSWGWREVGAFRLSIKAGRRPQYWAYASFRADRAATAAPAHGTGCVTEVTIYLNFLKCGRSEEEARRLVAVLNDWRDRHQGQHRQNPDSEADGL